MQNLKREGFENFDCDIQLTGDVMFDAALFYSHRSDQYPTLRSLNLTAGKYYLATIHRAENTDDKDNLQQIMAALQQLHGDCPVVLPLHPRTRKILQERIIPASIQIIDPVGYFDMLNLIKGAKLVLTDSGGLQKEAYFFQKFCVTMRDQTEWVELIHAGFNILTGASQEKILRAVKEFNARSVEAKSALYGTGDASGKIVSHLIQ